MYASALFRRSLLFALAFSGFTRARGRTPWGGRIALSVPWPLSGMDPHRLDDTAAAIFSEALFETLYAHRGGTVIPLLAESEPTLVDGSLRIPLRKGVMFPSGQPLDVSCVGFSLRRARGLGAAALLSTIPKATAHGTHTLVFPMQDAKKLMGALASPLVSMVPENFHPARPEGTGPFRWVRTKEGATLLRNHRAAGGPAFLEEIRVQSARDLKGPLSAFEAGAVDVGWLGSGLFESRPGSRPFDAGHVAWAVLRVGTEAKRVAAFGAAQSLCDALPPTALSGMNLGTPWHASGSAEWTEAPAEILAPDDAPWLVRLAIDVAALMSNPGHEVSPKPVPRSEFSRVRADRTFALAVDVVRPLGPGMHGALLALATADDPARARELAKSPPRGDFSVRALPARFGFQLGVLGEVRIQGGRIPELQMVNREGGGVSWGDAFRRPKG